MRELPRAAQAFVVAVALCGASVLAWRFATGPIQGDAGFLTLILLCGLLGPRTFWQIWRESFLWTLVSYLAGGSISVGMVWLFGAFGPYSLVLGIPPILLIYFLLRFYIDRANERAKRIEEIQRHNEMLESEVA